MANPGSITNNVPDPDSFARNVRDVQRNAQEMASARSLAQSQIGSGGTLTVAGALVVTGTISTPGVLSSAGGLTATAGNITAPAGNVSAGGTVSAPAITATADVTAGGNVNATGTVVGTAGISSIGSYNNLLTSGYRGLWVKTPTGEFGYVPSSRRFKQDETNATLPPALVRRLQLVTFRYIAAVEEFGSEAATEWGLIAEEVHALGLTWLVDYDEVGLPFGLKLDKLALALLPVIQDDDRRISALEARLDAAGI
jgi:hypothetical protein